MSSNLEEYMKIIENVEEVDSLEAAFKAIEAYHKLESHGSNALDLLRLNYLIDGIENEKLLQAFEYHLIDCFDCLQELTNLKYFLDASEIYAIDIIAEVREKELAKREKFDFSENSNQKLYDILNAKNGYPERNPVFGGKVRDIKKEEPPLRLELNMFKTFMFIPGTFRNTMDMLKESMIKDDNIEKPMAIKVEKAIINIMSDNEIDEHFVENFYELLKIELQKLKADLEYLDIIKKKILKVFSKK